MTLSDSNDADGRLPTAETVPIDMVAVVLVVAAIVGLYAVGAGRPVRFLVAVPLLFFLPGYVLVGVLFPRSGPPSGRVPAAGAQSTSTVGDRSQVGLTERLALSVGLSVALVPLFGIGLELLPVAAFDGAILPALVVFVLVGAVVASVRRLRTPAVDRFRFPIDSIHGAITAPFDPEMARGERLATIALAVALLVAVVATGYVFAVPPSGESFTDLRVMTGSPADPTLGEYPEEITTDGAELVVGIDNREGRQQTYTIVVTADQLIERTESVRPIESTELLRFETSLDDGQRRLQPMTITPDTGGEYRISYYLYRGVAPDEAGPESADRHVHFTTRMVGDGGSPDGEPIDGEPDLDGTVDTDRGRTEPIPEQPPSLTADR
ncbi:DUF1616 domain-containing protein [Halohasta salina]|uniref:DUF1616 domain-containing protein n=1 Tax=Halohasta salina TaxID=2961621 RepID=UPI0020A40CF2|nr:DUF1616 domain-containing protein [Halohasta salina]